MLQTLLSLLISTLAALAAAYILPGVTLTGFTPALIVAIILGILNALLFPILLVVTIPLNIITLGLFTFVIMGFLVWLTSLMVPGFHVANFWWCMLFGVIFAIINYIIREVF